MKASLAKVTMMVMLSLFVISCGKAPSNVLTDLKVETNVQNSDVWLSVTASLNLGAMNFAAITIPVKHPKTGQPIGELDLIPGLGGSNQIKIGVDLSSLMDVGAEQAYLPNGNLVPLLANNPVISVDVGRGAKIYILISNKGTAIAAAIPVSAFDSVGRAVAGINLFPVVNIKGVVASAGLFTSKEAGKNGIAIAVDVTKFINPSSLVPSAAQLSLMQSAAAQDSAIMDLRSHAPSAAQKSVLDSAILKLNLKKAILKLK